MNFDLVRPCRQCPFLRTTPPAVTRERAGELARGLEDGASFVCHKTARYDEEDGEYVPGHREQHCAGALILLEGLGLPSQMMRIAERLGFYDAQALDMSSDVYESLDEFIENQDARAADAGRRPAQSDA